VMLDSMKDWRRTGIGGHTIGAFVEIDPLNRVHFETGVNLLGGVLVGARLPLAAQNQTIWDIAPAGQWTSLFTPGSWGGHAMAAVAYARPGVVLVTWGGLKLATWEWIHSYVDECYGPISLDWVNDHTLAPNGFDMLTLYADLGSLARRKFDLGA
jgi:hypothetical protein